MTEKHKSCINDELIPKKKEKRSVLTGFCTATNPDRLKNLSGVFHKGDWRCNKLIRI